jgi:hypothetical protein
MSCRPAHPRIGIVATITGAVVGSAMLGLFGAWSGNQLLGAVCGALLGGLLGRGAALGWVSPVTLGAMFFASLACATAPSVDDYSGMTAFPEAGFGAVVGWFGRRAWRARR